MNGAIKSHLRKKTQLFIKGGDVVDIDVVHDDDVVAVVGDDDVNTVVDVDVFSLKDVDLRISSLSLASTVVRLTSPFSFLEKSGCFHRSSFKRGVSASSVATGTAEKVRRTAELEGAICIELCLCSASVLSTGKKERLSSTASLTNLPSVGVAR